jgi:hypothetical protein
MSDVTTPAATQQSITDQTTAALDRALSVLDRIYDRKILPDELNLAREIAAGQAALKLARAPASAPPEASGLRETCDALATEWENEALRRDRDAAAEKAASKRDRLILGASFERNHADRLRAALAATPDARPDPRDAVIEAARGLMEIVDGSRGVEGWHLNGDVATWDEFEQPEALRSALAALPASPQATTPALDRLQSRLDALDSAITAADRLLAETAPSHDAKENA